MNAMGPGDHADEDRPLPIESVEDVLCDHISPKTDDETATPSPGLAYAFEEYSWADGVMSTTVTCVSGQAPEVTISVHAHAHIDDQASEVTISIHHSFTADGVRTVIESEDDERTPQSFSDDEIDALSRHILTRFVFSPGY